MSSPMGGQAARFVAVGVLNTVVGLSVILAGLAFLGLGDVEANALGYAVGLVVSFIGNRLWTFRDRGPWGSSLLRFLLVFAGAYCINLLTLFCVRDGLRLGSYLGQVVGVVAYSMSFFVGSRTLAFRNPVPPLS